MARVVGFRGALLNPVKVDVASVAMAPLLGVKDRLAKGELVRDEQPAMYRYHQTFTLQRRRVTRKTLIVAVALEPWSTGVIRPHEHTSTMARELATRGITNERAHTEAVFCGYRDDAHAIEHAFENLERKLPALHVTTSDGNVHTVWRETDPDVIAGVQSSLAGQPLHVLDGNGRYEGMLAVRDTLGSDNLPASAAARYGLACLADLDDPALEIVSRHRVLRDAGARIDVLTNAKPFFAIERVPGAGDNFIKQHVALGDIGERPGFLALFANDPDAWKLTLLPGVDVKSPQPTDLVVLEEILLGRVIPKASARSVVEAATVVRAVEDGGVGVMLRPLTREQLLRADETGQLLPFGSTAFRPALARLVTHLIDPDEDIRDKPAA